MFKIPFIEHTAKSRDNQANTVKDSNIDPNKKADIFIQQENNRHKETLFAIGGMVFIGTTALLLHKYSNSDTELPSPASALDD